MTNAEHPEHEMALFLSGDLDDAATERIADHLESCMDCQAEFARQADAMVLIGKVMTPPAELPSRFPWRTWASVIARAAAVMLVFWAGMLSQQWLAADDVASRQVVAGRGESTGDEFADATRARRLTALQQAQSGTNNGLARGILSLRALTR